MNKTPNYQLNQWDKSDRIQMEDFNADNAKIEAALQQLRDASPVEWLLDVTTTAAASNQYNLDVSGIDFTQYREVRLYVEVNPDSTATSLSVRLNGGTAYHDSYGATESLCGISFDVNKRNCYASMTLLLGGEMVSGYSTCDYASATQYWPSAGSRRITVLSSAELNTINFIFSQKTLAAGTQFKMLGVKK